MNAALMAQIQQGKGLKKVPAHQKRDASAAVAGNVVGESGSNIRFDTK